MKTIKTQPNQTIFDLAVQWYGNVEAAGEIFFNNPDLTNDPALLTDDTAFYFDLPLMPESEVWIDPESRLVKQSVLRELQDNDIATFDLENYGQND